MKGYTADRSGAVFLDGDKVASVELDGYSIQEVIGSGANGIAFLVWNERLERDEVVKIYPPRVDRPDFDDTERHGQAREEAAKVAGMNHPGIAQVYYLDIFWEQGIPFNSRGWPYCVMQYRAGKPLREMLPALKDDDSVRRKILRSVLEVLTHAERHHRSLHGDLHGDNVLVDIVRGEPEVSVIDFGTSMIAGHDFSATRHARMLRLTAYEVLPELRSYLNDTASLRRLVGFDMLPSLRAGLDLVDVIEGRLELSPRAIGARLAEAAVFEPTALVRALELRLADSTIPVMRRAFLEFLTHDHSVQASTLDGEELEKQIEEALRTTNFGVLGRRQHGMLGCRRPQCACCQ